MAVLQPLFSVWVGPNVVDFAFFQDTVIYAKAEGTVLIGRYNKDSVLEVDTLLTTSPGVRLLCESSPLLYLAYYRKVLVYKFDTLKGRMGFPFIISGLTCRGDTLFLHDSHSVYMKAPSAAPTLIYSSQDVLKSLFFKGDTLFLFQRNYLIRLKDTPDTVVKFENLADISAVFPLGRVYAMLFGSGELVIYYPRGKKGRVKTSLILEGILRLKVRGDTLMVLRNDTLAMYRVKLRGRRRWRR